jgi:hypothetical protein
MSNREEAIANGPASKSRIVGCVDHAGPCSELGGNPYEVFGWALDGDSPAASVVVYVNNVPATLARTGLWRKDVAQTIG